MASKNPENTKKSTRGNPQNLRPAPLWQKGQSGNPGGRPKEVLAPMLRQMAREHPEQVEKLSKLIWSQALRGDINYVKFISDRLDGPLVQKSESGPPGSFDRADGVPEEAAKIVIDAAKQFNKRAS